MRVTTDRDDPRLTKGVDTEPRPMAEVYLVLSEEERARGFVRPLRRSYVHVGPAGPKHPTVPLTPEQREAYAGVGYVCFERYPEGGSLIGRYWTQVQLDDAGEGCCEHTTMGDALCETYARDPGFYGATYCSGCEMHRPVNEFLWTEDGHRVGT